MGNKPFCYLFSLHLFSFGNMYSKLIFLDATFIAAQCREASPSHIFFFQLPRFIFCHDFSLQSCGFPGGVHLWGVFRKTVHGTGLGCGGCLLYTSSDSPVLFPFFFCFHPTRPCLEVVHFELGVRWWCCQCKFFMVVEIGPCL